MHQSIINKEPQYQNQRNSAHQNTPSNANTAYQEYIANRQSASKSLSLMCYNCVNNDISDQKKQIKQKLIEQDKAYIQELTKSIIKQQEDENTQIKQKKLKEREFLQKSYQESQKYKEERKSKEKQDNEKLAQQIKKTDIQDQNRIQQEVIQQYYKKKQFMESLDEQIKSRKLKTQNDSLNQWFKVGDEEKTEQIIQQKKIIERNLLKQQRDESLKMKESVLNEQEKQRKLQERQQADYQHQLDQQLKLAEQGKKRLMESQYSKYLQKAIQEQKEQKRNEKIMTAEEYRINCDLINKQIKNREEIEQNQEIQKKLQYIEELNQQYKQQLECKAKDKQKNRFIEQKLSEANKKYEYLRKELEKTIKKSCQKCNKSYDEKCLSKSKIF